MIKELRPEYHIYDAKNGREALECIQCTPIDIMITDIQMPIMNGLQLIETMGIKIKEMKVIILSAYGYFEYAQKAISLGAADYMLKPVDETKVEQVLAGTENKIKAERAENFDTQMNKLIHGLLNEHEVQRLEQRFPSIGNGVMIIIEFNPQGLPIWSTDRSHARQDEIKHAVKMDLHTVFSSFGQHAAFFVHGETDRIISFVSSTDPAHVLSAEYMEKLNEFIQQTANKYGIELTIGVGSKCTNVWHEANQSYKHMQTVLKYKFFTGYGKVICDKQFMVITNKQPCMKPEPERLTEAILQSDKEQLKQAMNDMFETMLKDGYPEPEQFIYSVANVIVNQAKINEKKLNPLISNLTAELFQCKDVEGMKVIIYEKLCAMMENLSCKKNKRNETIIETCKKYIEEHFAEDLSLGSLAKEFHFNPSYFSNFFKNYTQINICDYILKTRMKRAEQLLRNSSCKVYEIAKMVGYQDVKYFIRLFKKEYGSAPDEYRHLHGLE